MEPVVAKFTEWLADQPAADNLGVTDVINLQPSEKGFAPYPDFEVLNNRATDLQQARGGVQIFDDEESTAIYAGTTEDIYRVDDTSTYQRATALFAGPLNRDYKWQFVLFGDNLVAIHPEVALSAASVGGDTNFSLLAGSPPTASCGARVGDFLMVGNLTADPHDAVPGAPKSKRVRWCGFNNLDQWGTSTSTQADFNDMPEEGGPVMAITSAGDIFQQRHISRASYVGLPGVFSIDTPERNRGAISRDCVVPIGAVAPYISEDGLFVWNGTNSQPIGVGRVSKWFFDNLDFGAASQITAAVDYRNRCIAWAFPSNGSFLCNKVLLWNYSLNQFGKLEFEADEYIETLLASLTAATSLDSLGTLSADTLGTVSFDDSNYLASRALLAGFIGTSYGTFTGANRAATLETAEWSASDGNRMLVNRARPLTDAPSDSGLTVATGVRDQLEGEDLVYGTATAREADGECPVLSEGRYTRFKIVIPAGVDWNFLRGIRFNAEETGEY